MSSWKKVAHERFPGETINDQFDVYLAASRKMLNGALNFEPHMGKGHKGFISLELYEKCEDPISRAANNALDAAAYSVGYQAFMEDAAANNESRLYDLLEEIECQR